MKVDINKIHVDEEMLARVDVNMLAELVDTIKNIGIVEPIKVAVDDSGKYELVAGVRRLEAAKRAGLDEVEVEILDLGKLKENW